MEFGWILGGQDQGLGGEAVLESVLGGALAASFGLGAVGFCAVDASGFGFGQGRHWSPRWIRVAVRWLIQTPRRRETVVAEGDRGGGDA